MSQRHHVRSGSHGRKVLPAHARPSKPAPLKRGASYNNAHGQSGTGSRPGTAGNKKSGPEVVVQKSEDAEDMASFLQFW
jgi:hypothetical protein